MEEEIYSKQSLDDCNNLHRVVTFLFLKSHCVLTHLNRSKDAVSVCGLDGILDALVEFFTPNTSKIMVKKEPILRYVQM